MPHPAQKKKRWNRFKKGLKDKATVLRNFATSLWDEHEFWINTAAVKGGATAVGLAGAAFLSYAVALPVALAVSGAVVATTMIGLGAYGIVSGSIFVLDRVKATYRRVTGKEAPPPKKPFRQKVKENAFVRKMASTQFGRMVLKSHAWKLAKKFSRKQDSLMGGLALGGSLSSITMGALFIASQVTVLPVVLVGAGIAMTTYMTVRGVIDHVRIQKGKRAAAAAVKAAATPADDITVTHGIGENAVIPAQGTRPSLAARFKKWAGIGKPVKTVLSPPGAAPVPRPAP